MAALATAVKVGNIPPLERCLNTFSSCPSLPLPVLTVLLGRMNAFG